MKAGILSSLLTIVSLASAAAIEPQPEINTNRTFVPTPNGIATADTSSSGPTDHIAWWFAPSGSHITDFSVDMEVPALSPHPKVGTRYVWPGMEPSTYNWVFQNVIGDAQPHGEWTEATWWVGKTGSKEWPKHEVQHGDHIISTFKTLDKSYTWKETWTHKRNGAVVNSGGLNSVSFPEHGTMTAAMLVIEIWPTATWDFGSVTWTDISITMNSAETSWCTSPSFTNLDNKYTMTPPKATVKSGSCTCHIDKVVFHE